MNLIKQHITYLQDNPAGYWFKRKLYGYGWTPARPAGWVTVGVYIGFLLGIIWYAESASNVHVLLDTLLLAIFGATALLLTICWKTGEPLKWQWGQKDTK